MGCGGGKEQGRPNSADAREKVPCHPSGVIFRKGPGEGSNRETNSYTRGNVGMTNYTIDLRMKLF